MAARKLSWNEAIETLPDTVFFDLFRMYLGEIRTPFNKQNLVAELEALLHSASFQEAARFLLNDQDRLVLTVVRQFPGCTMDTLSFILEDNFSYAALNETVLSLEERLILYRSREGFGAPKTFAVCPAFSDLVDSVTSLALLFPPAEKTAAQEKTAPMDRGGAAVSPEFLASFLSFAASYGDFCKNDGTLKKRATQRIGAVFSDDFGGIGFFPLFIRSCVNLGLLRPGGGASGGADSEGADLVPDFDSWERFAAVPHSVRLAYLAAGALHSGGFFGTIQQSTRAYAAFLAGFAEFVPDMGYTAEILARAAHFQWASSIARERSRSGSHTYVDEAMNNAVTFGLFTPSSGGGVFYAYRDTPDNDGAKGITVDAALSVTVQPGLPLRCLVSLARYLDIRRYDTASTWSLTRSSCYRGFDAGCTPESIAAELRRLALHDLPRSVDVLLSDWFSTYRQVTVYRGFVVRVDLEKEKYLEKNSVLAEKIRSKIAPGIFLMAFKDNAEAIKLLEKNLNQDIARIHGSEGGGAENGVAAASTFEVKKNAAFPGDFSPVSEKTPAGAAKADAFLAELHKALGAMELPPEQRAELKARIDRRVILRKEQLKPSALRFIRAEATGLDFPGKLQLIEYAQNKGALLELGITGDAHNAVDGRVLGTPVWLEKQAADVVVTMRLEPKQLFQRYSVGQLRYIRRVPQSIFAEGD